MVHKSRRSLLKKLEDDRKTRIVHKSSRSVFGKLTPIRLYSHKPVSES